MRRGRRGGRGRAGRRPLGGLAGWLIPGPPVQLPDAPPRPGAAAAPGGRGVFAALRHRDFRLFYAGHLLSLVGTWMQSTAQGWLVLELTDSELLLGVVTAAGSLPVLLFSLYAGTLADRRDKRDIILTAQCAALVLALALAVLTGTGRITLPWIVLLVFLLGVANAFEVPTRQSFFAELVGKEDLGNAIALNSSAFNLTRVVGPAIAGTLIGAVGIAACFYLNAASYLFVIAGLLAMRHTRRRPTPPQEPLSERMREGFAWIWGHRLARTLVGLVAATSVLALPYAMLLPVYARDILGVGAQGLGYMLSAAGLGALIGGILLAGAAERVRRGRLMLISAVAFCLLVGAFSLTRWFPLSLLLLAGAGFTLIPFTATINTTLQTLVPDRLRGRVMSVYVVMFLGMSPLGSLQAGTLARLLGAPAALSIGAALLLVVIVGAWWRVGELREV